MNTTLAPQVDRDAFLAWYRRNRARSAQIFGLLHDDAYYERPIALRHPFAFYDGHIPAFSFLTLNERALGEAHLDVRLERLFERGIDPATLTDAQRHSRNDWPSRAEIAAFGAAVDARVEAALRGATLCDERVPRLARAQAAYTILEHEAMHHETLMYIISRLPPEKKHHVVQTHRDSRLTPATVRVPAGTVTLGAERDAIAFGWDNEFGSERHDVPAFAISKYPVTNGEYLAFVEAGGPAPPFWVRRDGDWRVLATFEELPLPASWPVYCTHEQAAAYAAWAGGALPSEAQYHRAAFGTPDGTERAFPWGDAPPASERGNFGFARYDPEPVDAHPAGGSAWGVYDLVGNGWEWTSTPFGPLRGFEPMASYPQYSTDFFDGKHYVMKGASPVTAAELIRRSFRNWFYDDYPYMYAKFHIVT